MNKEAIKELAKNGILKIIQAAADEYKGELDVPQYQGEETIYKLGEYHGMIAGVDCFMEELYKVASE